MRSGTDRDRQVDINSSDPPYQEGVWKDQGLQHRPVILQASPSFVLPASSLACVPLRHNMSWWQTCVSRIWLWWTLVSRSCIKKIEQFELFLQTCKQTSYHLHSSKKQSAVIRSLLLWSLECQNILWDESNTRFIINNFKCMLKFQPVLFIEKNAKWKHI